MISQARHQELENNEKVEFTAYAHVSAGEDNFFGPKGSDFK